MDTELTFLDGEQTVDSVMRRWPRAIRVFLDHGMLCVGCPIGTLHTIGEACRAHGVDLKPFLEALDRAARQGLDPAQGDGIVPVPASRREAGGEVADGVC